MQKIRVLIVDDAVVIRRILSEVLGSDPEIEVAGVAASGSIALQRIPQVNPDVITLDVEMPDMDGVETLRNIRRQWPNLPVIMFSTLTERGATATLEALSAGASDYVTKPANVGSVTVAMQRVREELIPKVKALSGRVATPPRPSPSTSPSTTSTASASPASPASEARPAAPLTRSVSRSGDRVPPKRSRAPLAHPRIEVLVIGCSTGGPNALSDLLPALPGGLPVPILIVQHMPPLFTKLLADRLDAKCGFPVSEAQHGAVLRPGEAWLAAGDHHMRLRRDGNLLRLALDQSPPENSCRPAVDPLFRSAAEHFGGGTLAVVLTGMGQDGLRGAEQVKDAGGQVLAQDEATSVVWGMPGFVARAGLADRLLPLLEIAPEITRRIHEGRAAA